MKRWTNDDMIEWIQNIGLSDKWKMMMVEAIKDTGCNGQDLIPIKTATDIGDSFGIKSPMLYNRVFRAMQKAKEEELKQATDAAARKFSYMNLQRNDQKSNEAFELQIFAQHKHWKIHELVTVNTTVNYVKELYKRESGLGTHVDDIMMYTKGKVMPGEKTLGQIGIVDERHLITVYFKMHGGMAQQIIDYDDNKDQQRERVIHFEKYNLRKSKKPDCIMQYDDDDYIDRAEIGCAAKHAMAADTMFNYIVSVLEKNIKAVSIQCPHCKTALNWDHCTRIADMTGEEYARWTRVIQQRLHGETKTCLHCNADCKRKEGVIIFRINCSACNGADWCWNCMKLWKNGGNMIVCGNGDCILMTNTNKSLAEAPKITPEYLKNVEIPSIRACPMCLTLIKHKKGCKHMRCAYGCNGEFCFVCLGKKENNKWPCNNHTYECEPAPVQIFK